MLLLLLGLALPWGGVALRFCPCFGITLVSAEQACPCNHTANSGSSCCHNGNSGPHQPPTCLLPVKLLPDAIPQSDLPLPGPLAAILPLAVFSLPELPVGELAARVPPCDRGPPFGGLPSYLRHRSLLL